MFWCRACPRSWRRLLFEAKKMRLRMLLLLMLLMLMLSLSESNYSDLIGSSRRGPRNETDVAFEIHKLTNKGLDG